MAKEKKKIELIKLTIQIGDTKVSVTKDEARDLHKALSEMFGEKTTEHHYHRPWYWPNTWYSYGGSALGGMLIGASSGSNQITSGYCQEVKTDDDRPRLSYSTGSVTLCASDYREQDEAA